MLPRQPFYRFLRQLPLKAVPSRKVHGQHFYCGTYSTKSQKEGPSTLLLICFARIVESSSLANCSASICINSETFRSLPFTMVNISPLVNRTLENRLVVWDTVIPTQVTVRIIEAAKVAEDEMLRSFNENAPYAIRREDTEALVKANFADADDTIVENLQVSLVCPLAKKKIRVPCRGTRCKHVQCFDAYAYLALNEGTLHPSWRCPVCNDQVLLQDIRVELYTLDALRKTDDQCSALILLPDGSWVPEADYDDHSAIIIDDSPVKDTGRTLWNGSVIDLTVDSD
ncbi:E3 SUMO-protein ligase PIAS3-like [Dermacentor andersoni]|uniref:E3 SUMO-protein ligase PIAS3-like n=1 Tax=Dermacentor andersoni TaxID=34620 RepID=UPI003B3B1892